ncbi:hypothetical protein BDR26DRAFT_1008568 [Obelidium mucronatum]|nr:hypothetical protein BDR26DRAFT_1008568 [Obelidium mucronatum]
MSSFVLPSVPASKLKSEVPIHQEATITTPNVPNATDKESQSREEPPPPPPLNYDEPSWSSLCPTANPFWFEIVKSGSIVDKIKVRKAVTVVGRLPTCEISLEHASVSRQHAVLQSSETQLFIYDLGSAHGTFLNKSAIPPRKHVSVKNGDMIKFGQSTRVFVVMGGPPAVSEEEEVEEQDIKAKSLFAFKKKQESKKPETAEKEEHEVSWGFAEDASNDEDQPGRGRMTANGDDDDEAFDLAGSAPDPDAYYYSDSKKALRTWCDSRNMEMVFSFDEIGPGHSKIYIATINLNLEGGYTVTGTGRGSRRKEAEKEAALDACVKLDKRNILRSTSSANKADIKRKAARHEDDEDSFFDRTERPKKPKLQSNISETFESLTLKLSEKTAEISAVDAEILSLDSESSKSTQNNSNNNGEEVDELDQLLTGLDNSTKLKQKRILTEKRRILEQESARLSKLVQVAKPHDVTLKSVKQPTPTASVKPVSATAPATESIPSESNSSTEAIASPSNQTSQQSPQQSPEPSSKTPSLGASSEAPKSPSKGDSTIPNKRKVTFEDDYDDAAVSSLTKLEQQPESKKQQPGRGHRRRQFMVMTRQQVNEHENVEKEDFVDALVHGGSGKVDKEEVNRYGY